MQLEWLDDVLILLEEGNMTRAAARRNITQPAFSRRIRGFEDWLGVEVLERQTNRVEISASLRANEAEMRRLTARLRELRARIGQFDPARSTLSIAAQHAPICSTFPDMALRAKERFPALQIRLRAGNLSDCVSMFLRGDTSMLLCYEAESATPLQFGSEIKRGLRGRDYLVPIVGGSLRFLVMDNGAVPTEIPAIAYPEESYFGEVLSKGQRAFGTREQSTNVFSVTAFSSGTHEMVLKGLGLGWLPYSMAHREIESGALISLANRYGREPLDVVVYANLKDEMAEALLQLWARGRQR